MTVRATPDALPDDVPQFRYRSQAISYRGLMHGALAPVLRTYEYAGERAGIDIRHEQVLLGRDAEALDLDQLWTSRMLQNLRAGESASGFVRRSPRLEHTPARPVLADQRLHGRRGVGCRWRKCRRIEENRVLAEQPATRP